MGCELYKTMVACCRRRRAFGCICLSLQSWPACAIEYLQAAAYSMHTRRSPHTPGTVSVMHRTKFHMPQRLFLMMMLEAVTERRRRTLAAGRLDS